MREFAQRLTPNSVARTFSRLHPISVPLQNAAIFGSRAWRNTSFVAEFLPASRADGAAFNRYVPA